MLSDHQTQKLSGSLVPLFRAASLLLLLDPLRPHGSKRSVPLLLLLT